ncbi:MAG: methyltransferase, partial [Nitrosomonas sp.]|nr:methyltransferase [Nitrosomonas sp.]
QLEQALQSQGITLAQIIQAVMVLTGSGQLSLVQEENEISRAKKYTDKLNQFLLRKSASSGDVACLASPVTGGGIAVGRFQQLLLLAMSKGKKNIDECVQFAWQILAGQGQRIIKQGKTLETDQENIQELKEQAEKLFAKQLSILKALQII